METKTDMTVANTITDRQSEDATMITIDQFEELAAAHIGYLRDRRNRLQLHQMMRARTVARWVYMQFINRNCMPDNPWAGEQPCPLCGYTDPALYAAWQYGGGKFLLRVVDGIMYAVRETEKAESRKKHSTVSAPSPSGRTGNGPRWCG